MNQLARWMELVDVFCDVHLLLLPFTCLLGLPLQPLISLSLFNPMTNVLRLYFDLVIVSWTVWRGDIFLPPSFGPFGSAGFMSERSEFYSDGAGVWFCATIQDSEHDYLLRILATASFIDVQLI